MRSVDEAVPTRQEVTICGEYELLFVWNAEFRGIVYFRSTCSEPINNKPLEICMVHFHTHSIF